MATQVQFRGGTTTEHASFTGAAREVTVDTTKDTVVVHDGSTAGGFPLLRAEGGAQDISTSGDITVNTDALFVDASAKNVGIGTSSPDYNLTIGDGSSYVIQSLKAASDEFCEFRFGDTAADAQEIGRASCRERV